MIDWDSCVLWLDSKYFSESYWWDRSKYRNNGVGHGAKWKGDSFYFDSINDYVDCGNRESLNIDDQISIEFLFAPVETGYILAKKNYDDWNSTYAVYCDMTYGRIKFYGNSASNVTSDNYVLNRNKTVHVVVVAENSGQTLFFINGKQEGLDNTPAFSGDGERCFVGARPNMGGTASFFLGAYLFFLRVYHTLLSANEVKILYNLTYWKW